MTDTAIVWFRRVTGAETVCWNRCYESGAVERDRQIKQRLHEGGSTVRSFSGSLLVEPWNGAKADGDPYRVFTPFWKLVQKRWMPAAAPTPHPISASSTPSCKARNSTRTATMSGGGVRNWRIGRSNASTSH